MNIHDMNSRFGIPYKYLRQLQRAKLLVVDEDDEIVSEIRRKLARNQPLSAGMLVAAVRMPEIADMLESATYAKRLRDQLAALGKVAETAAPADVCAFIDSAAGKDARGAKEIAAWARTVLPVEPVPYAWLAVRLLFHVPGKLQQRAQNRISLAMTKVRRAMPDCVDEREIDGKKVIFYRKPLLFSIDL